eukprot:TRINITY_DN43290_c0_g1_i1.p1 TRINITY_DN43290_c0_g1~~TRINITY_DN43290_c0_g1_i1.p1  ORF type:complete len:552 (+),score=215.44 TRINITY_DN43290_c0_g1_i1:125-1780(+)
MSRVARTPSGATRTFEEYQAEKREREWSDKVKAKKAAMGNAERVKSATEWKRIGNDKFKAGNYWEAREYYREAIIYIEDLVDARRKEKNELIVPLYTNLAQVHLKVEENALAEDVCSKAICIADLERNQIPKSLKAKAQFRRGLARKALGKLEDAKEDFVSAQKLQPENEDVTRELKELKATLATQTQQAKAVMGGFLNREKEEKQKKKEQEEKRRQAEERRRERRARAEQKQQMQEAFEKLSKGKMLYEQREKEMEPVREKEKEKERTLELERDLLNIIDRSKGNPETKNLDEFMEKKKAQCEDQHAELDQKKKVLDKVKKEEQWDEDDAWKKQRDEHRKQLEERRAGGENEPAAARSLWESKEVARWCEQRLRDMLVATYLEGPELEPDVARKVVGDSVGTGYVIKALVTDVLKLNGDAAVMRLNAYKPPLHYYDYFIKLDFEVAVDKQGHRTYRSGDELISVAAKLDDGKAPEAVSEHALLGGTFKLREFCSEEEPKDGLWQLATKVKRPCSKHPELTQQAQELCDRLREKISRLLCRWAEEFRDHWK